MTPLSRKEMQSDLKDTSFFPLFSSDFVAYKDRVELKVKFLGPWAPWSIEEV
jgi:hypothetical protein